LQAKNVELLQANSQLEREKELLQQTLESLKGRKTVVRSYPTKRSSSYLSADKQQQQDLSHVPDPTTISETPALAEEMGVEPRRTIRELKTTTMFQMPPRSLECSQGTTSKKLTPKASNRIIALFRRHASSSSEDPEAEMSKNMQVSPSSSSSLKQHLTPSRKKEGAASSIYLKLDDKIESMASF
jgi:hypothetical protein